MMGNIIKIKIGADVSDFHKKTKYAYRATRRVLWRINFYRFMDKLFTKKYDKYIYGFASVWFIAIVIIQVWKKVF